MKTITLDLETRQAIAAELNRMTKELQQAYGLRVSPVSLYKEDLYTMAWPGNGQFIELTAASLDELNEKAHAVLTPEGIANAKRKAAEQLLAEAQALLDTKPTAAA